jgi:hypothetical protein
LLRLSDVGHGKSRFAAISRNPQQHRTRGAANDNPSALRTLV